MDWKSLDREPAQNFPEGSASHLSGHPPPTSLGWRGRGQEGIRELTSTSAANAAFRPSLVSQWKEKEEAERQAWDQTGIREAGRVARNESRKPNSCFKDRSRRVWGALKVDTGGNYPGWPHLEQDPTHLILDKQVTCPCLSLLT